jgi:hypothetical protein
MDHYTKEQNLQKEYQAIIKTVSDPDEILRLRLEYIEKKSVLMDEKIEYEQNKIKKLNEESDNIYYNLSYNRRGCMRIQEYGGCSKCGLLTKVVAFGEDEYGEGCACKSCILKLFA